MRQYRSSNSINEIRGQSSNRLLIKMTQVFSTESQESKVDLHKMLTEENIALISGYTGRSRTINK